MLNGVEQKQGDRIGVTVVIQVRDDRGLDKGSGRMERRK